MTKEDALLLGEEFADEKSRPLLPKLKSVLCGLTVGKGWRRGPPFIEVKNSGCWEWQGCDNGGGYRSLYYEKKRYRAHRFIYERVVGAIPENLCLDHLCRNRACVNPAHLELVTFRENVLRGIGLTARQAKQTHCKYGHEFTEENTYRQPGKRSRRECLKCKRRLGKLWRKNKISNRSAR